jgi:glycosyltransferase involved in cell wall biosynthesis
MLVAAIIGFLPLVRLLRHERPDVLILNLLVAPAILAAKVSGVSCALVVSVQGYPHFLGIEAAHTPVWKRIENAFRKWLWNRVYPKADRVLTMTEQTRRKLEEQTELKSMQLRALPNPVIDDRLISNGNGPVDHAWFGKDVPVLVGMGRLTQQKGFDILLHAFSKLLTSGIDARLIVIGEGEDRARLETQASQLGIEQYVDFLGYKENPFPYVAQADLFVLSSRWEDPGHAIIEAAALGTPIVTTDCPSGPSDLVGYGAGGFICRTEDPDDMAATIRMALAEYDLDKLRVARDNAAKYTLLSHYNEMEGLLNELR